MVLLVIAQLSSRQSVATNAAGIDNAGSKWSREAQTKFVPRGLRQDSIINGSLFHYNRKYFAGPHFLLLSPFYEHYDEILNFYNNRSSNAMAECFNAKIKLFRANLRGVVDKKFFLFRISNLYDYPQ